MAFASDINIKGEQAKTVLRVGPKLVIIAIMGLGSDGKRATVLTENRRAMLAHAFIYNLTWLETFFI